MAISDWAYPSGIMPRSLLASDSPGAVKLVSFVSSAGVETGDVGKAVRLFNDRGSACVQGGVYMVGFDATVAQNPKVETCVAETSVSRQVVVAMDATADQAWGWFFYAGYCNALVDGDATDVAAGDYLKITAGTNADAFIGNTTSRTVDSFAIAMEANTSTEALKKVFMLGDPADVD
jgi:hypothetical protein